jgi:D-alanyl-D-alanine carboxypeptidase (penicillin-binding protein 5/6)
MRLLPVVRRTAAGVAVGLVLLGTAGPASAEEARPTVDPSAPSPTAPYENGPPQGHAPDGSTVGGDGLDTRGLVTATGAPALPEGIDAHGWLVADATSGAVLGAQDPHGRYYPASTLKTLTLLTLAPVLDHDLVVEGTVEDENIEGSRVGLVRGGQYSVDLLFRALMMQSGNDAANALARAAGGVESAVAAMNETAERLGAADTVAGTPSGLDVAGQSSSPYDLALIMRELVADPYTLDVLQTPTAQMPPVPGLTEGYQIQNEDTLLETYPGTLGGKTGFTDAARHTFVVAAERDGRRLVVSVMQAERVPVNAKDQAARLLDWGFAVPAGAQGVGRLVDPGEVPMVAVPEASETADGALSAEDATALSASAARTRGPDVALASTSGDPGSPWVPVALAAGAVGIVTATVVGRRRAVRRVPPSGPAVGPPPRRSPSRHPAGPGPA